MRPLGKPGRNHEIRRILPRHSKILDLSLAGHKNVTIAKIVGMTTGAISLILRSPLVQSELKRRRESSTEIEVMKLDREAVRGKALSILEQESSTAAETIVQLMGCEDPSIQLRSAVSILDRVFPKENGTGGTVVNVELTGEHAQLLVLAMKESDNGKNNQQSADLTSADAPEGEQATVHQISETPPDAE